MFPFSNTIQFLCHEHIYLYVNFQMEQKQRTTQLNHSFVASKVMSCKPVDNKTFVRQPSEQFKHMDRLLKMFLCALCYKTVQSSTSLLYLIYPNWDESEL